MHDQPQKPVVEHVELAPSTSVDQQEPRLFHTKYDHPELQKLAKFINQCLVYLLPKDFPESVHAPQYIRYCKWQALQYVLGSMGGVLSTQSLLYAVGLGSGSIPLAAALNWIIKDGLGQLGGVLFASRVSTNFDADPKKWRFRGELIMVLSTFLEIITPIFPKFFLVQASLANIGKNIAFLTASATRAAINLSFCKQDNLGDITAKAGSQTITASLIGTGLGICLSPIVGSAISSVFPAFCVIALLQLYSLYRAVSCVQLDTFNLQRLEIAVHKFLEIRRIGDTSRQMLTPEQVCKQERFVLPHSPSLFEDAQSQMHVNPAIDRFIESAEELTRLRETFIDCKYMLLVREKPLAGEEAAAMPEKVMEYVQSVTNLPLSQPPKYHIALWFFEDAQTSDVIKGVMHAALVSKKLAEGVPFDSTFNLVAEQSTQVTTLANEFEHKARESSWNIQNNFVDNTARRIKFE